MTQKVIIEFNEDGSSSVEAHGIKGQSCTDVTKPFEEALGKVTESHKTAEFYDKPLKQTRTVR